MRYSKIDNQDKHIKILINWLIDEVKESGGDGDGIWYSKYFEINNIVEFITANNLLPQNWKIIKRNNYISLGYSQECLVITNSKEVFDQRPDWQQVSLEY